VTYGDVLGVESHRTWEFNTTLPLRSQTVAYCIYGLPLEATKLADRMISYYLGINILGPYLVHLLPRLVLLCLSFLVDFTVYQATVQ
jgi:phosphatidylinositol glycan class Z